MKTNQWGEIIYDEWFKTGKIRSDVESGQCVVMPNHFHGILILSYHETTYRRVTARRVPTEQFGAPVPGSLPTIVRAFKSAVTKRIHEISLSPGTPVWQSNYYEHIIRNEADYTRIAEYITDNPRRWNEDKLNPDHAEFFTKTKT